jgi:hypothetical protein
VLLFRNGLCLEVSRSADATVVVLDARLGLVRCEARQAQPLEQMLALTELLQVGWAELLQWALTEATRVENLACSPSAATPSVAL